MAITEEYLKAIAEQALLSLSAKSLERLCLTKDTKPHHKSKRFVSVMKNLDEIHGADSASLRTMFKKAQWNDILNDAKFKLSVNQKVKELEAKKKPAAEVAEAEVVKAKKKRDPSPTKKPVAKVADAAKPKLNMPKITASNF